MELFYLAASFGTLVVGFVVYHLSTFLMSERSYEDQLELRRRQLAVEGGGKNQAKRKEKSKSDNKLKKKNEIESAGTGETPVPQIAPEASSRESSTKEVALKPVPNNHKNNSNVNANVERPKKAAPSEEREILMTTNKQKERAAGAEKVKHHEDKQKNGSKKSILVNGHEIPPKAQEPVALVARSGRARTVSFNDDPDAALSTPPVTEVVTQVAAKATTAEQVIVLKDSGIRPEAPQLVEPSDSVDSRKRGSVHKSESPRRAAALELPKSLPQINADAQRVEKITKELNEARTQLAISQKHVAAVEHELRAAFAVERERIEVETTRRISEVNRQLEDAHRRADAAQRDAEAARAQLGIVQREHEQVVVRANSSEQQRRSLDERVRALDSELRRLRAERANIDAKLNSESRELDAQKLAEIEMLRGDLTRLHATLGSTEQDRDRLEVLRRQLEKHVDDLKAREHDLTRELESALTREQALQSEHSSLLAEKQSLTVLLGDARQRLTATELQLNGKLDEVTQRLTRERDTIRSQFEEQVSRVGELTVRLEEAEQKLGALPLNDGRDEQLHELETNLKMKEDENVSLRIEFTKLHNALDQLKLENDHLRTEVASANEDASTFKQQLDDIKHKQSDSDEAAQAELDRLRDELSKQRTESAQLEEALSVANEQMDQRTKALESLDVQLASLQSVAKQHEENQHTLSAQLSVKDEEISKLNDQVRHVEAEKHRVLQEVEARVHQMDESIEADRTALRLEIAVKSELVERLEADLATAHHELETERTKAHEMEVKMTELEKRCAAEQNHQEDAKRRIHDLLDAGVRLSSNDSDDGELHRHADTDGNGINNEVNGTEI